MSDVAINLQGNRQKIEKSQSGFWSKPRNILFAGFGVAALTYLVWESVFSESGVGLTLQQGVSPINTDPSVGVAAAFFGARKLLSFAGPNYFPRGPAFDLGAPIQNDFFLGERNSSTYMALTEESFVDSGGNNVRTIGTVGDLTGPVASFQVGPDPQPYLPQRHAALAKRTDGDLGVVYSTAISIGGSGVLFTAIDKNGAEIISEQSVIAGPDSFDYPPSIKDLPNGDFLISAVKDTRFELEVRSGIDGSFVAGGGTTVLGNTDGSRHSSIKLNGDGTVYGVFESHGTGAVDEITLQKYDATLSIVGSSTSFPGSKPKVVTLPSEEIDVYYLNDDSNLARRRFSFSGTDYTAVGGETIVSSRTLLNYELEDASSGWTAAYSDGQNCYVQPIEEDGAVVQEELNTNDSALSQTMCRIKQMGVDLVVGFKRNASAWIRIFKENVAPVVTQAIGNINLFSGQQQVIDLTQHFSDADVAEFGETLTYSAIGTFPGSVQGSDLILQPGQVDIGTVQDFTVTAEDEAGNRADISGSVTTVNQVPTFDDTTTILQTVKEGDVVSIPLPSVGDDDPSGTYSLQNPPSGVSIESQTNLVFAPLLGTVGVSNFDLVYTDPHGEQTTRSVQLTVSDDQAPLFPQPAPTYTCTAGLKCEGRLPSVTDVEGAVVLSLQGAPSGVTISEYGGEQTSLLMDDTVPVGTHNFNFVATDSKGQTTLLPAQVTVAPNAAPVMTISDDWDTQLKGTQGVSTPYDFPPVTDEGDVTFYFKGNPKEVSIEEDPLDPTIQTRFIVTPTEAGPLSLTLVARDAQGLETEHELTIDVSAPAATSGDSTSLHWTFYAGIVLNSLNAIYRLVKRIKNRKLEENKYGFFDFCKDSAYVLYHFTLVLPFLYWCYTKYKYRNNKGGEDKVSTAPPSIRSLSSYEGPRKELENEVELTSRSNVDSPSSWKASSGTHEHDLVNSEGQDDPADEMIDRQGINLVKLDFEE